MPHVHVAAAHTAAAAVAAALVHAHPHQTDAVEQSIDRAQRAKEAAEAAITEYAGQTDDEHNNKLARKETAQHAVKARVVGIGKQPHRAFERTGGTDIFAKARHRNIVPQPNPQWDRRRKENEDPVFQPGQRPCPAAFPDFIGGDLVQQLLEQPQRAEPAADAAAQGHTEEQEDTHHIPGCAMTAGGQRVLDRAQRAGADRAGAGIAVQARDAGVLCPALIDLAVDKSLQMRVMQQRAVKLDEPSCRGAEGWPPTTHTLIQDRRTPYKSLPLCQRRPLRCR